MKTEFTEGPWTILPERGQSQVRTVVAGDFQVCDCVGLTPDGDPEGGDTYAGSAVNMANARLISAAPELFEACKWAARFITGIQVPREDERRRLFDKLDNAIKKAEGGK